MVKNILKNCKKDTTPESLRVFLPENPKLMSKHGQKWLKDGHKFFKKCMIYGDLNKKINYL